MEVAKHIAEKTFLENYNRRSSYVPHEHLLEYAERDLEGSCG